MKKFIGFILSIAVLITFSFSVFASTQRFTNGFYVIQYNEGDNTYFYIVGKTIEMSSNEYVLGEEVYNSKNHSGYSYLTSRCKVTFGDVDGDGKITAEDARLSLRIAVGLETYHNCSWKLFAAGAGCDGRVYSNITRQILRMSVGLDDNDFSSVYFGEDWTYSTYLSQMFRSNFGTNYEIHYFDYISAAESYIECYEIDNLC